MPKQFKTYDRFDGGLNTKDHVRSIKDNELSTASNAIVDEFGMVKSCGKAADNDTDYTNPSVTASQPGYGLFQASFDFDASANNTNTVRTFIADADDGTNAVVHVLDGGGWDTNDISLGAVTGSNQAKIIYHMADGTVFVCDTNVGNTATTIKQYKYKKAMARWKDSGGSSLLNTQNIGWSDFDTKLSKPTSGICGDQVIGTTAGAGNSTTALIAADVDAFANFETELDKGTYYGIAVGSAAEAITNRTNDTTLVMPSGGVTWGDGAAYAIYPPQSTGFNLDFTVASGGSWSAATYEFATSFVYDGDQESLLRQLDGEIAIPADNKVTCVVLANENPSSAGYSLDITGGRIYQRIKDSDDAWTLFGDISFTEGARPSLSGEYTFWTKDVSADGYLYSSFVSSGANVDTYESLNGFSPSTKYFALGEAGEKYQTSVVANRRVFIANVKYTTDGGNLQNFGDQIRYSQINKFLTFPEFNFINIGVNDGESFIRLEAFADRLLAFKERTLYIINIGGGSDTQWFLESEHKNLGVEFHSAVIKTALGVCWVNKNGLYLYDGSKITNLQTKILESDWKDFVNSDTIIGYEPVNKHLCAVRDANNESTDNGDTYICNLNNGAFTFIEDLFPDGNKSNIITDAYNKMTATDGLSQILSYDGEPDAGTTFSIVLKDDDFGLPNIVKKIYGVVIEYSSSAAGTVVYSYTDDKGVAQGTATIGTLASTSGDMDINRFNFNNSGFPEPKLASSFKIFISATGSSVYNINNIAVEYRPMPYKRVAYTRGS